MKTHILKEMLALIKAEEQRRVLLLTEKDPNFAYDHWLFEDEPFLNELCLMLLVAFRHQIEKELVLLTAQAVYEKEEISAQEYQARVKELRKRGGWKTIQYKLGLDCSDEYKSLEPLRLLANSYKHNPSMMPDEDLLKMLRLRNWS